MIPADHPPRTGGPRIRADVVDVYVARTSSRGLEVLQLQRVDAPMAGTWQPIMGHIEPGETAVACAWRELHEEVGLARTSPALLHMFALEQVHPYYLAELDVVMLSPRFLAEVAPDWEPTLNDEHHAHRWIDVRDSDATFMWPGQVAAVAEIVRLTRRDSPARQALRLGP